MVVLEPAVVRGGEVELGNRLDAHAAQAHDFVAELVRRPAALDRELRMARVHEALADVDDEHVESALRHAVDHAPPQLVLVAERVVRTVSLMYRGSGLHVVGQPFAPHVVAEVEQQGLDLVGARPLGRRGRRHAAGKAGRSGKCEELASV